MIDGDLLDDLNGERTRRFPAPRNTFDPRNTDPDELEIAGLPPMPDPEAQRDLHAFWLMLLSPPLSPVDVQFAPYPPDDNVRSAGSLALMSRHQMSRNWSGGSVAPRDGLMLTDAIGLWIVPGVWAPPADGDYRSSTWIGLDGQRSYLDATLPQIGTAQRVKRTGGVPVYTTRSWVQWWPEIPELFIPGLRVRAGDVMGAWVRTIRPRAAGDPMAVRLFILNFGPPPIFLGFPIHPPRPYAVFEWDVPKTRWPDLKTSPILQPAVAGGTAEWVMERPTVIGSEDLYELPRYNEVIFDFCFALEASQPRRFFGDPGRIARMTGPTLTHMYRVEGSPRQAVTISKAERLGAHSFRTFPPPP